MIKKKANVFPRGTKERGFCPGSSDNFMMRKASPPPRAHNDVWGLTLKGQSQKKTPAPTWEADLCSSVGGQVRRGQKAETEES